MSSEPVEELAGVDPDETQFRTDTILMHAELLELELYRIRRELFSDPGMVQVQVGQGQPVEQTIRGFQGNPYNGVIVYNPTPVTLAVGFQAGLGVLSPATVPPFSFASFPERYVNLSVAVLGLSDQQAVSPNPVTILRTRMPPATAAGPYGPPTGGPFLSIPAGGAGVANGLALDNGIPRNNHNLFVVAAGAPTAGAVNLQASNDGQNWTQPAGLAAINAAGVWTVNATGPYRWIRASIGGAITGGTVTATVASA